MDDEDIDIGAVVEIGKVPFAKDAEGSLVRLPEQSSPTDTCNWDDREFSTPSGRIVIETDQNDVSDDIIAE